MGLFSTTRQLYIIIYDYQQNRHQTTLENLVITNYDIMSFYNK